MRRMSTQVCSGVRGLLIHQMCLGLFFFFFFPCKCEVHLEAALGWGLLFSSVRHEARSLIRTHLLVREMLRSDYSSSLISYPPHFSCCAGNRLPLVWQTNTTTRRWHGTTVSNLKDFCRIAQMQILKGHAPNEVSHLCHLPPALSWRRVKKGRQGGCWFLTSLQRCEYIWKHQSSRGLQVSLSRHWRIIIKGSIVLV